MAKGLDEIRVGREFTEFGVEIGGLLEQLFQPALHGGHAEGLHVLEVPLDSGGLAANLNFHVHRMWFALAGCGLVVLHPICEIVKRLRLAAAVWSPNHHFGNLGIDKRALELILHALVKLCAAEIKPGVGGVDLRINREALAVLETKPVLEPLSKPER